MQGSTYAVRQGSGPRQRRKVAGFIVPAPSSVWYGCMSTQSRSAQYDSRARIMSWKLRPPIRRPILLSLHQPLGWRAEPEAAVQLVGVARVQEPFAVGPRAPLDHLAHELDTEPAAPELGEHVHVR